MKNRKFPCVCGLTSVLCTRQHFSIHERTTRVGTSYLLARSRTRSCPAGRAVPASLSRPGERRALATQLQWPWHHPAQSGECRVCCADRIVDCALVIAGKNAGRTHSQRRRSPRSTVKLSLAIEGILERRVLALEILERLGSASRRLPLELENLQGAGCRMQDAGCRMQGAGCRAPLSNSSTCRVRPAR